VVGGRWVGSHGPTGGSLSRQTSRPLVYGPDMTEGHRLAELRYCILWIASLAGFRGMLPVEIVQASAGLRVWSGRDHERLLLIAWHILEAWSGGVELVQACAGLGGKPSGMEIVCVCVCVYPQHDRPQGHGPMEWISVQPRADLEAQWNRDHGCLDCQCVRPWGHGQAE
jgi:hypothetical protein